MTQTFPVAGITAYDLCALDDSDPPLSLERDLGLLKPASSPPTTYKNPDIDRTTFWQSSGRMHP